MNKKLNTILFLVAATALNLLILVVLAVFLMLVMGWLIRDIEEISRGLTIFAIIVVLTGSIGGTFFLYSRIIKWAVKKWKLDSRTAPIFKDNRQY